MLAGASLMLFQDATRVHATLYRSSLSCSPSLIQMYLYNGHTA